MENISARIAQAVVIFELLSTDLHKKVSCFCRTPIGSVDSALSNSNLGEHQLDVMVSYENSV